MKKLFLASALSIVTATSALAQTSSDVKVGIGLKHFTNRHVYNIMVPALEGEYTKRLNNILSFSGAVGVGLGRRESFVSSEINQHAFLSSLDGNIFLSPFGNQRKYNLKLGTGVSVLYASEWYTGTEYVESRAHYDRVRTGLNAIMEHEWSVGEKSIVGVKTMLQPYLKQEWVGSLLFKYGVRI